MPHHRNRKYDPALLLQLAQQPKSKGGRPRTTATLEERRAADVQSHRIARERAKLIAEGKPIPEELKPKCRKYATPEERQQAKKQQAKKAYYKAHEKHKLKQAIAYTRKKFNI